MGRKTRGSNRDAPDKLLLRGTDDHYLDAELYDFEYRDRDEDIEWYREFVADEPGPILELGAGSGRITMPLAADGRHVIALDRMATMLERLRYKLKVDPELASLVRIVEGDMTDIPLRAGSVGTVISPFNALMHLYQWEQLLACFKEARRLLRPGGAFAFDVQLPDTEWLMWDSDVRHAVTPFTHPGTGARMIYSTNHVYDPVTQVCHVRLYYDEAPPRGRKFNAKHPPDRPVAMAHLAHRQIYPQELRALIHAAGLELQSVFGDFSGGTARGGCEVQLVVCRKPVNPRA
jgi:ubiquinone/menaquinone biosynthesis C-methylase UbiE